MLLSGLGAAAAELDARVALALLDAFQRQGWFRAAGEARTVGELRAGCVAAYARFLPEAVGILQAAGGPHSCAESHVVSQRQPEHIDTACDRGRRRSSQVQYTCMSALGVQ